MLWGIAGLCTLFATLSTFYLVWKHISHYRNPRQQRYILRIIWMVPIYSIESFLSLMYPHFSLSFHVPRDIYESYVLYNFLALCIDYMGGEEDARIFLESQAPLKHMTPCKCLGQHTMPLFFDSCRFYILQYSIVKPLTAVITLVLFWLNLYDESSFSVLESNFWIALINNVSISFALYYIVAFHYASKENPRLAIHKPFWKFLSIKLVIFCSFWQTLLIGMLSSFNFIDQKVTMFGVYIVSSARLPDLLICLEMAVVAFAHINIFSCEDYLETQSVAVSVLSPVEQSLEPPSPSQEVSSETLCICATEEDNSLGDTYDINDDRVVFNEVSSGTFSSSSIDSSSSVVSQRREEHMVMTRKEAFVDMFSVQDIVQDIKSSFRSVPLLGKHGLFTSFYWFSDWLHGENINNTATQRRMNQDRDINTSPIRSSTQLNPIYSHGTGGGSSSSSCVSAIKGLQLKILNTSDPKDRLDIRAQIARIEMQERENEMELD